jgi:hypothetical protein
MSDDFFAPPPFDPAAALATLRRTLRDLKLAERAGAFELAGQPVARASVDGPALALEMARRPARSPDWERSKATDHAMVRKFVDELRRRLARWAEGRDD